MLKKERERVPALHSSLCIDMMFKCLMLPNSLLTQRGLDLSLNYDFIRHFHFFLVLALSYNSVTFTRTLLLIY